MTVGARVLHVLPSDLARGAQVYARGLVDALAGGGDEHHIVALFSSTARGLRADVELDVPSGRLRDVAGFDPRAAYRLRGALGRLRPDLVVAHGGEALKYVAIAAPRSLRLVYYKIGVGSDQLRRPLRLALHRRLVRRAQVVAAVSPETRDEAAGLLAVPADRLVLLPNGRDGTIYRPGPARAEGRARLLFVGHLTPGKRPEVFLAVVAALRRRGLEVSAAIAGDGPLATHLEEEAARCGVELLGRRHDVPDLLARTDVLVFPSAGEGEGMPGVLIEAGLAGVATVTTAVAGAAWIVEDGCSGFVVQVDDLEGLVDCTARLVAEPELRRRMGTAARERCLRHFSLQASARRWQALIDQVLGREGGAAPLAAAAETPG